MAADLKLIALGSLAALSLFASVAAGQVIEEMSPERIAEAIKVGESARERDRPGYYVLQQRSGWGNGPRVGFFTTPFSRVVAAAHEAKKLYKPFGPSDVSAEMIAPEFIVYATSQSKSLNNGPAAILNVEAIVILPKGSKDRSHAIQPRHTSVVRVKL